MIFYMQLLINTNLLAFKIALKNHVTAYIVMQP